MSVYNNGYVLDEMSQRCYIIDDLTGYTTTMAGYSFPVFAAANTGTGAGVFKERVGDTLFFKSLVASGGTQISFTDDEIIIYSSASGGGSGSTIYTGASPTNVTVGALAAGTNILNRSLSSIIEEMVVTYLSPAFSSFSVTGQATTIEVGTSLSGSKTFTWATTNSGNVQSNSIVIRDVTASSNLATGLANDGSESATIATIQLNSDGSTQSWRGQGTNTNSVGFNSSNFTVTSRYFRFFGPTASSPSNSAQVRALPSNAFHTAGATFTLNTGNSQTKFVVALPPTRTISSVIDVDALNANITSSYVLTGTINVVDAGGTNRSYNIYEMNLGAAYAISHAHVITTA